MKMLRFIGISAQVPTFWIRPKRSNEPKVHPIKPNFRNEAPIRKLGKHRKPITSDGVSNTPLPVLLAQITPTA